MSSDSIEEARRLLFDLLLSPYTSMSPWAITNACIYLDHPMRPSGAACICGKVKGRETA